jgi:hypothetical protein
MKEPGANTMLKKVLIAGLTISLLMIPFLVHAEIYKWVDERGNFHFTDDYSTIPEKYGPHIERMSLPEESRPAPEGEKTGSKTVEIPLGGSIAQEIPLLFSGLISAVSDSGMSIAVTAEAKEMVFTVFDDTSIRTDSGQSVSFGKLKNGMSATVEYVKEGDSNRARSIKVNLLLAGATNEALGNPDAPGKNQNAGDIQKGVWAKQKKHKLPTK